MPTRRNKVWGFLGSFGTEDVKDIQLVRDYIKHLEQCLHSQQNHTIPAPWGHPDYEYEMVEVGLNTNEDPRSKLQGDGWELNGEESVHRQIYGEYIERWFFRRYITRRTK